MKKRQQMQVAIFLLAARPGNNRDTNVATRRLVWLVNTNELAKGAIRIRVVSR